MPVVTNALLPHSPLLLPAIGKDSQSALHETLASFEHIKKELVEKGVEVVVLFTTSDEHKKHRKLFRIHLPAQYSAQFSSFGDLVTSAEFPSDPVLGTDIKNELLHANIKISYKSDPKLEYTAGVPLTLLLEKTSIKVIVIEPAEDDNQVLYDIGRVIASPLQRSSKKIACIASGDLARCAQKKSHEHFATTCLPFNYIFLDAVQKKDPKALLEIDRKEAEKMGVCALPVSCVLRGVIDTLTWEANPLSYQAPFDVGYAAIEFIV